MSSDSGSGVVKDGPPPVKPAGPTAKPSAFAFKLIQEVPFSATGNTMVSPVSVEMAMSGLAPGMGGSDLGLLLKVLAPGTSSDQLMQRQKDLIHSMASRADSPLRLANSVWISKLIQAKPDYIRSLTSNLDSEVRQFTPTDASLKDINGWVAEKTRGRIPEIFDQLKPADVLLLINAVAFDGKWQTQFDVKQTTPQRFHAPGGPVQVPMMHIKAEMPFTSDDTLKTLKMSYQGGEFSMLLLLPAVGDPAGLLKSLTPDKVGSLSSTEESGEVTIAIPKFKFSDSHQLEAPLTQMGLGKLFDSADFGGMSDELQGGRISEVVHKTFIEVDEKGTKAAAATGIKMQPTMVRADPPEFIADRPFAFLIVHEPTGSIVFAGVVNNPTAGG